MAGESPLSMMRPPAQRLQQPATARRRRRSIIVPLVIVVALALAWTGMWYYAAGVADRTLAGWVEREAAAGRSYACGTQSIGGFPFRIDARCADATVAIKQPPYTVKAAAVTFAAEIYHPTRLIGDIASPLVLAPAGQPPVAVADWTKARLTVRGVPPNPESVAVELEGAHIDRGIGASGSGGGTIFKAAKADLNGRIIAGAPNDHPVIEVTLKLAGATAPNTHPLLSEPLDIELDCVLRGFNDLKPKPWAERFREMQAAGGGVEIKSLRLVQATATVVGAGTLNVNAQGKLDGLIRVAIAGIEQIVPRLGIDRMIAQGFDKLSGSEGSAAQGVAALDRLVPGLSGALRQSANASLIENLKKMGQPSSIGKEPATVLPLRFNDGAIYLGMLRIAEVPPLF